MCIWVWVSISSLSVHFWVSHGVQLHHILAKSDKNTAVHLCDCTLQIQSKHSPSTSSPILEGIGLTTMSVWQILSDKKKTLCPLKTRQEKIINRPETQTECDWIWASKFSAKLQVALVISSMFDFRHYDQWTGSIIRVAPQWLPSDSSLYWSYYGYYSYYS